MAKGNRFSTARGSGTGSLALTCTKTGSKTAAPPDKKHTRAVHPVRMDQAGSGFQAECNQPTARAGRASYSAQDTWAVRTGPNGSKFRCMGVHSHWATAGPALSGKAVSDLVFAKKHGSV